MEISARQLSQAGLLAALSFLGSLMMIPIGPVPITLQTLFVLLSGLLLSPQAAVLSQLLHLLLVLFLRGFQSVWTPSFGFLFGFIAAAGCMAWLRTNRKQNDLVLTLIGTAIIYLIGTPYMALIVNGFLKSGLSFQQILLSGMLLFLPGDVLKVFLAAAAAKSLRRSRFVVK